MLSINNGVLLVPPGHALAAWNQDDARLHRWHPSKPLEELLQAAQEMEQDPRGSEEQLNVRDSSTMSGGNQMQGADKRGAEWISRMEERVCDSSGAQAPQIILLKIIGATATSNASTHLQATNVMTNDNSEWAVQVESSGGQHTLALELEQRACVLGIIIHQGTRGRTFTKMNVCATSENSTANVMELPQGEPEHRAWLNEPIRSKSIDLCCSQQYVAGTSGSAGLKYVELWRHLLEPEGEDTERASKRRW